MSSNEDFEATVREAISLFAARDADCARFGAARHRWAVRPALDEARVAELERAANVRLPDDYRAYVRGIGDGGAGPYHGLLPLDHPVQRERLGGRFDPQAPYRGGAIAIGHLGCGYLALLVIDEASDARGQVWIDARGAGVPVRAAYPTFRHYVADWIARIAHAEWLEAWVPAGACALPGALSAYFRAVEERRGMPEGSLAGEALREALDAIPDDGIATTHDGGSPYFAKGDPVDLCVACARLGEALGLRKGMIAPGLAPIPGREPQ